MGKRSKIERINGENFVLEGKNDFICDKNCKSEILQRLEIPPTPMFCRHAVEYVVVLFKKKP